MMFTPWAAFTVRRPAHVVHALDLGEGFRVSHGINGACDNATLPLPESQEMNDGRRKV